MSILTVLIASLSLVVMVGCNGGGADATQASPAADNGSSSTGDPTTPPAGPGTNPTTPPVTPPVPQGPQPGEKVGTSTGDSNATYPPVGGSVDYTVNNTVEPNTDIYKPIITITAEPNPYIPNTTGQIQFWAADNQGGIGLKHLECSIDGGAWTVCNENLDMSGLSEGTHTVKARAEDYDGNVSGEVSYTFYVDTTPPALQIDSTPAVATTSTDANVDFSAQDAGSGVQNTTCRIDGNVVANCQVNNLDEGMHTVEVTAVDAVGNASAPQTYQWLVDNSGPQINFAQEPAGQVYLEDGSNMLNFNVADTYSPQNVTYACDLNGQAVACNSGQNLTVPAPQAQFYTFTVVATDSLGNQTTVVRRWEAVPEAEARQTTLSVDDSKPVDILFVVDNSGSMAFERSSLAQRIDGMIDVIKDLDWQIGVISTDSTNNDAKSDGRLIELRGMPGQYVLDSTMDTATAQSVFGDTVQNFGGGSGNEEGMYSSRRMIERYFAGDASNQGFLRDGADLSIVVLSDEDESSDGNGARITPQGFIDFVNTSFNGTKTLRWHSIIARPGDSVCLNGEGANYGNEYDALSRLLGHGQVGGSIIGSVCDTDYTNQLRNIGQNVAALANSLRLDCAPYDGDKDGQPDLVIEYRATPADPYTVYTAPRTIVGSTVSFSTTLPAGEYRADYRCKIN